MPMYTLRVVKSSGEVLSVGGAAYRYPPWTPEMEAQEIPEYEVIKVDNWPDDPGTPGRHTIDKKAVIVDLKSIIDVKAQKGDKKTGIKKGDFLYKRGVVKRRPKEARHD